MHALCRHRHLLQQQPQLQQQQQQQQQQQLKIVPIFGLRKNVKRPRTSVALAKQLRKIARVLANFANTNRICGCKIDF